MEVFMDNIKLIKKVNNLINKYGLESEEFQNKIYNLWINNNLTYQQEQFLDEVKNKLNGQSSIDGYYLDEGYVVKL